MNGRMSGSDRPVALITGAGPGAGAAISRRLAVDGYRVAMAARSAERLAALQADIPHSRGYVCDVSDPKQIAEMVNKVLRELGPVEVLIHNAVGGVMGSEQVQGVFGNFMEIEPASLERNFQVNTMALLHLGQALAPAMIEAGKGAIVVTGNTSALRGKAGFAGFAPTKAAQRILAESMARYLGPKGVHVAYLVIDAVIDVPWTRKQLPDAKDSFFIKPSAIADEVSHLLRQDPSAWSFNVEIRPQGEPW